MRGAMRSALADVTGTSQLDASLSSSVPWRLEISEWSEGTDNWLWKCGSWWCQHSRGAVEPHTLSL